MLLQVSCVNDLILNVTSAPKTLPQLVCKVLQSTCLWHMSPILKATCPIFTKLSLCVLSVAVAQSSPRDSAVYVVPVLWTMSFFSFHVMRLLPQHGHCGQAWQRLACIVNLQHNFWMPRCLTWCNTITLHNEQWGQNLWSTIALLTEWCIEKIQIPWHTELALQSLHVMLAHSVILTDSLEE